jgi:hypothetical protein
MLFFLATMIVAIFGYILASTPSAYAADVTWAGGSINYEGNQYQKIVDETTQNTTNLPAGTHYAFIDDQQKAHVISFPVGADPANTTSVDYAVYDFVPPGTYNNKTGARTASIETQTNANQGVTSCNSDATRGIGWIICPVTNWLAGAMDWLFGILTNFLKVRPAQTNADSALYRAWSVMRNFANVLFVIGFMLIIYSQLTSFGISNYGIKRVLPRLIVAAILVNISYWVCAIAIDLSNILGYSLQDLFIAMRNSIVGPGQGNSWSIASWESVTGFILSGGTAVAAATLGIRALTAGSVGSALYMLLPILVGVLMAVLVALLILAARQAIITVLVIIAPLAFVAYLLPNTEKYFDKWRGLFMTMLLVFPMFSVLFGGAQLAGLAIIQNADSINLVILGMAVQVAPVVITPFLVKFSGSLLGRIAGMVNNPNRGAIDRTRKWASERGGQHRDRVLSKKNPNWMNRRTQSMDRKRREREERQGVHKTMADARRANEKSYADIQQAALEASQIKETGETRATGRYEASKRTNPWLQQTDLEARASKQDLETNQAATNLDWENLKAGRADGLISPMSVAQSGLAMNVRNNTERSQALASSLHSAQHMQQRNFAEELERDPGLRAFAGGIDPSGALKAEARAMSEISDASNKDVEAGKALLNYKAIMENSTLKEKSKTIVENVVNGTGAQYDKNEIEAALEAQANDGAITVLQKARLSQHMDQGMVTRVFARNAGTLKSKGGFHLQANPEISTLAEMNAASVSSLASTSAANIKELKEGWLSEMASKLNNPTDTIITDADSVDTATLKKVYENVYTALDNEEVWGDITDRAEYVQAIEERLRIHLGKTSKPKHAKP